MLLDRRKIVNKLNDQEIEVTLLGEISSTNDFFNNISRFHTPSICIAECQTQGRGRLDRSWNSPTEQNIYLSMLYKFKKNIDELSGLNLVTGLAVQAALHEYSELDIKWPNDILYENEKLAGILIETTSLGQFTYVIAGVGVNVNMEKCDIEKSWTSLRRITGKTLDRNIIIAKLINELIYSYKDFEIKGFDHFRTAWNAQDVLRNKEISLQQEKEIFKGRSLGIDITGNLLLELDDKTIKSFSYGDTSILSF